MDATCTIQDSIHVFSLVHKYVSRILGTYHLMLTFLKIKKVKKVVDKTWSLEYTNKGVSDDTK